MADNCRISGRLPMLREDEPKEQTVFVPKTDDQQLCSGCTYLTNLGHHVA